jgi:hypothetical protein
MASYRLIITLSSTMLTAMALSPVSSLASSLLSGYGGPGEGNQAILGSALLNGPSSGGGASGGGSSGSSSTASTGVPAGTALRNVEGGVRSGRASGPARSGSQLDRTPGKASTSGLRSAEQAADLTASRQRAGRSSAPVLSGADLAYILVALGALVLTGCVTRQITQQPR